MSKQGVLLFHKRRPIYGVGINDADYPTEVKELTSYINGKQTYRVIWKCPFKATWDAMIKRCYCSKTKIRQNCYEDVICCEEWLTFSNFKSWMEQQKWEGKYLDKDLLKANNKIYSPDSCVFVTRKVNNFLLKADKRRGSDPLGVSWHKHHNAFQARVCSCLEDKSKLLFLGYHETPESAHRAWQRAKIKIGLDLKEQQTDPRVVKGLQRVIDKIQYDLENNLITEDF